MVSTVNPKKAMHRNEDNMQAIVVASEYNTMVLGSSSSNAASTPTSHRGSGSQTKVPTVVLLPHQHTLFCERKVILSSSTLIEI